MQSPRVGPFKNFLLGALFAYATMLGCASSKEFPWPYYAEKLDPSCYSSGQLLGKAGAWSDLPLSECQPDGATKLKCMTVKIADFYDLKFDNENCHQQLQLCEKGPRPQ